MPPPAVAPVIRYFQKPIYHCPECPRSYKSPVRLTNHVQQKHPSYYDDEPPSPPTTRTKRARMDDKYHDNATPDTSRSPLSEVGLQLTLYSHNNNNEFNTHKHAHKDETELYLAKEHSNNRRISPIQSPRDNSDRKITVKGRTYECTGIRISNINDEVRFVECLEKNRQRLQLANIALNNGLITPEEYATKQREFMNAFTFF